MKQPHKKEFDTYAHNYRDNLDKNLWLSGESSTFFAEYKAQKLKEWLPHQTTEKLAILDFGCGDGVMTSFVKNIYQGADVYGVDPSVESIEVARMAYETINFSVSGDKLEFDDNSLDVIFSAGTFHHIPFEQHESYVQEIHRILKPGGRFVMFELNPLNPMTVYTFKNNPIDKNATMMKSWYTKKLLKKYGAVSTKFYCFYPNFLHWMRWSEPYLTWLPFGALYACIMQKKT